MTRVGFDRLDAPDPNEVGADEAPGSAVVQPRPIMGPVNATGLTLDEIRALTPEDFSYDPHVILFGFPGEDVGPEDVENALRTATAVHGCTVTGLDRDGIELKVTLLPGRCVAGVGR